MHPMLCKSLQTLIVAKLINLSTYFHCNKSSVIRRPFGNLTIANYCKKSRSLIVQAYKFTKIFQKRLKT